MSDPAEVEKLQPSLLDRLTDESPDKGQESRDRRVMSMQNYRQAVMRDLEWLLNTPAHLTFEDLEGFDEIRSSVVNYGLRDVHGMSLSGLGLDEMEAELVKTIRNFEPRLVPESVSVRGLADLDAVEHSALSFEIRGELWAQPLPESLFIRTEIDLETGQCALSKQANG